MNKLSRRKIAYDFDISPYGVTVVYNGQRIDYVFSSELNRCKFIERQYEHREKINESLSNRFNIKVELPVLSDIKLYSSIEKRGFLLIVDGVKVPCQSSITLDGNKVIYLS